MAPHAFTILRKWRVVKLSDAIQSDEYSELEKAELVENMNLLYGMVKYG